MTDPDRTGDPPSHLPVPDACIDDDRRRRTDDCTAVRPRSLRRHGTADHPADAAGRTPADRVVER